MFFQLYMKMNTKEILLKCDFMKDCKVEGFPRCKNL